MIASIIVYCLEIRVLLPKQVWSSVQTLVVVCLVGPVLGGLPSPATLASVFFRGMSDQLTFQLCLLRTAVKNGVSRSGTHKVTKLHVPWNPSPQALVVDPTHLNLIQIRRPEHVMRKWIEDGLSEMTTSSQLLKLFQMDLTASAQVLAQDLFSMSPKFPRLMSHIFSLSNVAYGPSMLDKFLEIEHGYSDQAKYKPPTHH